MELKWDRALDRRVPVNIGRQREVFGIVRERHQIQQQRYDGDLELEEERMGACYRREQCVYHYQESGAVYRGESDPLHDHRQGSDQLYDAGAVCEGEATQ